MSELIAMSSPTPDQTKPADTVAIWDEKFLREHALRLAVRNREPEDTVTGETQVARAKRYLEFMRPSGS
jgi:hypothetical protein